MIINLTSLITNLSDKINFEDTIKLDKSYLKNTDIKNISNIKVKGYIKPYNNDFEIIMNIKCTLTLVCSISLKDVKYDININVNEVVSNDDDFEENNKIINNTIDLIPIIWQNIILEVPLKVVSDDVTIKNMNGDGWRLITEEEVNNKDIDPRLEKLKNFLNE